MTAAFSLWPSDRKSTRLNSSHLVISYAVFCLKKNSPVSAEEKSSSIWIFCCLSSLRLMTYWPRLLGRSFGHRVRLGLSISPPFFFFFDSRAPPTSLPPPPPAPFCS